MLKNIKLLKTGKDRIVYSLLSIGLLNDKFIDAVPWPADKDFLIFRLAKKNVVKGKPVEDMVSLKKYVCRTTYVFNRRDLPNYDKDDRLAGFKLAPFKNMAEYKTVSRKTHDRCFLKPFKDYLTPAYGAEYENYIKNTLPKTKGISVRKDGEIVAMLSLLKVKGKIFSPMHWISWIWVDARQPKEARRAIHSMLRWWVHKNSTKYVGAAIHAANLKSQKWFIKSGGWPVQIFFSRR